MDAKEKAVRILWIDIAKAYGIILVFYGHFVERLSRLGYEAAFIPLKFIYSFHMPLFFIGVVIFIKEITLVSQTFLNIS